MSLQEQDILLVVQSIWQNVLGMEVYQAPDHQLPPSQRGYQTGLIQLTGEWAGAVKLTCSEALLRSAASSMFDLAESELPSESLHDALGELTNMMAGNLKALLPGPSHLCLPAIVPGTDQVVRVPDSRPILRVPFYCGTHLMAVSLSEAVVAPVRWGGE